MALFAERKRIRQLQEREALGESFWTESIPQVARYQLAHVYEEIATRLSPLSDFRTAVSGEYCMALGLPYAYIQVRELANLEDADRFLSFLEAVHQILLRPGRGQSYAAGFAGAINAVFNSHRVAYKFIPERSEFVELESLELHTHVVEPAIRLVYGDPRLDAAETAYMNALKQISHNDAPNAITDAATALQETLKALGAEGKMLGDQLKEVQKRNLLPGRDSPLLDSVVKAMAWVASERNQNGDAHNVTQATLDDAWLIVHVVGALIVRLAGTPRS